MSGIFGGGGSLSNSINSIFNIAGNPTLDNQIVNQAITVNDGTVGIYDYWQCLNVYSQDQGSIVLPTCNPNGTNRRANISSPMTTIVRRWATARLGSVPAVPSQEPDDPNLVYIEGTPQLRELGVGGDGVSFLYEAYGVYIYQVLDPSQLVYLATIPPTLDPQASQLPSLWFNSQDTSSTINLIPPVNNGNLTTNTLTGSGPTSGGNSSPLGSNSLLYSVPN